MLVKTQMNNQAELVKVPCHCIRVGSFRFSPSKPLSVAKDSILLHATLVEDKFNITLPISFDEIVKLEFYLNDDMPVLFLQTTKECAENMCTNLHLIEGSDSYYNPTGKDETQKRITIFPEILDPKQKDHLSRIFLGPDFLDSVKVLNHSEAKSILIQATPHPLVSWQAGKYISVDTKLITYQPQPHAGGITIQVRDYNRLSPGELLNDVIIDFYLKYLFCEKLSEVDRQRTHVFSSYFWPCLTRKDDPIKKADKRPSNEDDAKLFMAEQRHAKVKGWTRNVDIFTKDFIIIPINTDSHWFLAIICFPGLEKPVPMSEYTSTKSTNGNESNVSNCTCNLNRAIVQPCILIFDSMAGPYQTKIMSILKDYLRVEWRVKRGTIRKFDKTQIKASMPKVPKQLNGFDCGVYILQYAENFFENPIKDFSIPITGLKEWFSVEKVRLKRIDITNLIDKLHKQQEKSSVS